MPRERILITVKTYPTLSASYGELVCTAGLREDGSWIRIYPVPNGTGLSHISLIFNERKVGRVAH